MFIFTSTRAALDSGLVGIHIAGPEVQALPSPFFLWLALDQDTIFVKIITVEELDAAFREVRPQVGKASYYRVNPQRFAARYAFLSQQLV